VSAQGPISDREAAASEISSEILQVHEESYGSGAHEIKTHLLEDLVLIVIDVELTPAEETLLASDNAIQVKRNREDFEAIIEATFRAIVERITGRRVESFLSAMSMDPLFSVELFRLAPRS
jgi:uncharacterized protein YbcI